jgi:hypothetical protein
MTAAARQKRYRTREALGLAVYSVEADGAILNGLQDAGLLREHEVTDKAKVGEAMTMALRVFAANALALRVTLIAGGRT